MSDLKRSRDLLLRYLTARIPFITVDTVEKARTLEILKDVSEELNLGFFAHSMSKGVYNLMDEKVLCEDKSVYGAIDFFGEQMKHRQNLTLILTEIPDYSTENSESQRLASLVSMANENGGSIVVLTSNPIWNQLQRMGMSIKIDLPNEDEMYEIIHEYLNDYRREITIEWDEEDEREAASMLAGITCIEAENVIAALVATRNIRKEDMDEVRFAKDRMFSDISGLEKINVDDSIAEVGGLDGLRKWLDEKKVLFSPEKRGQLKQLGLKQPRGILLVGVPGCGKSLSAKSIALKWKLPLYRLDFATVQGSYVGQSEQQLKNALTTAEDVSPCVLWIDEIEKGLSGAGGGGDGGVSTRMVGQFLFWLQECMKQVFVVATANDISMLPSELIRRGRFDELFFVDLPTAEERYDILSMYMRKYLGLEFAGPFADEIVSLSDGFTGADLESTVRELAYRKLANEDFVLNEDNIISTFNNVVPLSQTSPEKIESIRDWGKERAVPASGRPIGSEEITKRKSGVHMRKVLI